jgi:hypothetical protein
MTFSPTVLYVKTHTVTGLKYFGKTCSLDRISRYWGSGKAWRKHLQEHGKTFTTEVVGFYVEKDRCVNAALQFSKDYDIVKSTEWANEVIENGLNGMAYKAKLKPRTEEQRNAQRKPRGPYGPHKVASPKKGKPTGIRPTNAGKVHTCPHCQNVGVSPNIFKYHFKYCKGL